MTMISKALAQLPKKPHALYRFYDRTDVLLYVGITANLSSRMAAHKRDKPWWVEVRNITIEYYDTRQEALETEAAAIRTEKPLYNSTHNELVPTPDRVPEVVTWTPHGPRTGPITAEWIEKNWFMIPCTVRDRVEVPSHALGRMELAEGILDYYTDAEVAELCDEVRDDFGEEEDDEFPFPLPRGTREDPGLAGAAALKAFEREHFDVLRLRKAIGHLLESLPPDVRSSVMDRAEDDLRFNSGSDYTKLDLECWAVFCLGYAIQKRDVAVRAGVPRPTPDPWAPHADCSA